MLTKLKKYISYLILRSKIVLNKENKVRRPKDALEALESETTEQVLREELEGTDGLQLEDGTIVTLSKDIDLETRKRKIVLTSDRSGVFPSFE